MRRKRDFNGRKSQKVLKKNKTKKKDKADNMKDKE